MPVAALALLYEEPWLCPNCANVPRAVGAVANPPRAPPGRGGGQHTKRFRFAAEGSKNKRACTKAAGRIRELRLRG
jgi:hypothetical protein